MLALINNCITKYCVEYDVWRRYTQTKKDTHIAHLNSVHALCDSCYTCYQNGNLRDSALMLPLKLESQRNVGCELCASRQ